MKSRSSLLGAVLLAPLVLNLPSAFAARGGPDAGGWSWADSREPGITTTVESPATTTPVGPPSMTDEQVFEVGLSFPFTLYGVTSSRVWISTNGWLSLVDPGLNAVPANPGMPDPAAPNATIAFAWDDMLLAITEIGVAPEGDVIQFHYYQDQPVPQTWVEGWVEFYRNGTLKIAYSTTPTLNTITVGIESEDGLRGTQIARDGVFAPGVTIAAPWAVQFFPPNPLDCAGADPLPICPEPVAGTTVGSAAGARWYSCTTTARTGSERVYRIDQARSGPFSASLSDLGGRDQALFLIREGCVAAFDCVAGGTTSISLPALARGTYYLVVDGATAADDGSFTLTATPSVSDCNKNGVGDSCDLFNGTSEDCNGDLRPDECNGNCPVDVVFVMDTSGSMNPVAAQLCADIDATIVTLGNEGIDFQAFIWGITDTAIGCLTDTVVAQLGTAVPGPPPPVPPLDVLDHQESWAQATAVVAGLFPWRTDAQRVVVPISDEGAYRGNPTNDPGDDRDVIQHAISVAVANDVKASPITPDFAPAAVVKLAQDLAAGTGGTWWSTSTSSGGIGDAIIELVRDACAGHGAAANAGPDVEFCGATSITLDGSASTATCTGGVEYRWLDGITEVCGTWSTNPTCMVNLTTTTTYTLEVRCTLIPGCVFRDDMKATLGGAAPPGDLGNTVRSVQSGADVVHTWGTDPLALSYNLYRGTQKGVWPPVYRTGLPATVTLPDVAGPPFLYLYRTVGVDCAGQEGL